MDNEILERQNIADEIEETKIEYNKLREHLILLNKKMREHCLKHNIKFDLNNSDMLIHMCCDALNVKYDDIIVKNKKNKLVKERQCIMYALHEKFNSLHPEDPNFLSIKAIGKKFTNYKKIPYEHTTVLNSVKVVEQAIQKKERNPFLYDIYEKINKEINKQKNEKYN